MAFASHYQSATKQALVGGDLYDVAMTQYGPRLIIGDVKGKGLDAVGRCAAVLAVFRELAVAEPDLVDLATKMDAQVSKDMEIEDFVTVILADFAPGEVRVVNCGHRPPVKAAADSAELQLMAPEHPAIRQLVRLHLAHAGGQLADDVLLVLSEPVGARDVLSSSL